MARVPGKCPVCGQIIQVNDEKESGHCGQCGAVIQVQKCIQLLQNSGDSVPVSVASVQAAAIDVDQDEVARRRQEREKAKEAEMKMREKQLEAELKEKERRAAEEAKIREQKRAEEAKLQEQKRIAEAEEARIDQAIYDMFQLCTTEQDFLQLRSKIMGADYSNSEKAKLLETLDFATEDRLKDTIKKAKEWEKSQESPLNTLAGAVILAGIGFVVRKFFPKIGIVLIALAFIGLIGDLVDRLDKKKRTENKAAAELIAKYRQLGYKI